MLNWFSNQSLIGEIELKATCAPHYFRVARQRRVQEKRSAEAAHNRAIRLAAADDIGPTEIVMPGATGVSFKPTGAGNGHPGGHPSDMNAMTKGCLAGTGVCFISHEGEVYPCGYLPAIAGDLRKENFVDIWEKSTVFNALRDTGNLKGKCGCCEFRNICMGCRARAFAATGDFLEEEPFCVYQPKTTSIHNQKPLPEKLAMQPK